jgi:hypothetical protein
MWDCTKYTNIAEYTEAGEYVGNKSLQYQNTTKDNTWPIWDDMILCKVKHKDDNICKSLEVWDLRCQYMQYESEDFKKSCQIWGRLKSIQNEVN